MEIISRTVTPETVDFGQLEVGAVFQRLSSRKLYLKSTHSSGQGGNVVRLANGLRSTLRDDEQVIPRPDAQVGFDLDLEA